MELVYLWVEDYKNIQKQGFNFSPRFSCDYNEEKNELTIDENDDYIENFFGDNINVTAIVGKNGSGKSSVLEFFLLKEQRSKNNNFIFIYLNSSNLLEIYTNKKIIVATDVPYKQLGNIKYHEEDKEFKMIFSFAQYLARENHPKLDNQRVILLEQRSNISNFPEQEFNKLLKKLKVNNFINVKIRDTVNNKVQFGEKIFLKDLSFGETLLISLFVNITERIEDGKLNIFFLDEISLPFHPSWEKNIIKLLIEVFKDKNIHFVLSTHSPFLLSDIPKQNIIFLDKDENGNCKVVDGLKEKKQTFGANIHTLLSDSFFMEDGLMGEFAKSKIDKAINLLNQDKLSDKDLKYCEQIISIIGEPIVKNQLQRMLDSKRLKKVDEIDAIKKSMEAMQKRLDELEK